MELHGSKMTKPAIAHILKEIGFFLRLQGENPLNSTEYCVQRITARDYSRFLMDLKHERVSSRL